jgi:hypothetical protein
VQTSLSHTLAQLVADIQPDPTLAASYITRSPVEIACQEAHEFSEHEVGGASLTPRTLRHTTNITLPLPPALGAELFLSDTATRVHEDACGVTCPHCVLSQNSSCSQGSSMLFALFFSFSFSSCVLATTLAQYLAQRSTRPPLLTGTLDIAQTRHRQRTLTLTHSNCTGCFANA